MKLNKNMLVCVFTVVSSFIGAGFVSGAEIALFFINFNIFSIHFAVFSLLLFALVLYLLLNTKSNPTQKSNWFSIIQIIIYLGFCSVMLSGISEINNIVFNTNIPILTIISSLLLYILIKQEIKIWAKVSSILCIFMIIIIIIVCYSNINGIVLNPIPKISFISHINPILYFSMNTLVLLPISRRLGQTLATKKEKTIVATLSTVIICILIVLILLTLQNNNYHSMPLLFYASNISTIFYYIYLLTIVISIFTTLLSCFYALTDYSSKYLTNSTINNIACLLLCSCLSMIGFNKIFQYAYPLIGAIGLFIIPKYLLQKNNLTKLQTQLKTNNLSLNKNNK